MKYFVLCAALFIGAHAGILSAEDKAKIEKVHEKCMKETNADPEILKKARQGEYTDDPKLKEQILCFSKTIGVQDASGKFLMDKVKERLMPIVKDEAIADSTAKKCAVDKATPQESAFEAAKCFHQLVPKGESLFD